MRPVAQLFDLTGRLALVTGSSRGLGRVLAEGLAQARDFIERVEHRVGIE